MKKHVFSLFFCNKPFIFQKILRYLQNISKKREYIVFLKYIKVGFYKRKHFIILTIKYNNI